MRILGIDPGLNACGVAIYDTETKTVESVFTVRTKITLSTLALRVLSVCGEISYLTGSETLDLVVIEKPQVYQGALQKGDPNDLIDLTVLVGALVQGSRRSEILLTTPRQWKGQVPKNIHHKRIRKRLPDLGRCSKDAMDAVGLCLYGADHHA